MKKISLLIFTFCSLMTTAQNLPTANDWQNDLRYYQKKVHEEYPFLFVKTTKEIFDSEIEKLYGLIPSLEDHEIIVGLSRIHALFKYGHMTVGYDSGPFKFHYLPINLYQFSDGIYLQGVHKDYENTIGAKVIEINGVAIKEVMKLIYPMVSAENSQYFKSFGLRFLTITEVLHAQGITRSLMKSVEFTLEKDGLVFKQVFTAMNPGQQVPKRYGYVFGDENWLDAREQDTIPLYLDQLEKMYSFRFLTKEKSVYVRLSQIEDDPSERMEDFYSRLFNFIEEEDVKKLIIDVRLNGGGNNFKNRTLLTRIIENKRINKVGHLFFIIGKRTFSACQNLVNEAHNYTNAIFVGEPTAENINFYGDVRQVTLPKSKIPVFLSYAWWQNKPAWDNKEWLAPSIQVEMSFKEYSTNQDPVLDTVLNFSDNNFKPNPMRYITDLFLRGDINQLDKEVPKMIKDSRYSFFDFEKEITDAGLRLVNSGIPQGIEPGIGVLSFVVRLFPKSAYALNNLAQAYLIFGDTEKAKEILQKSIALDLNGIYGKKAKILLEEMPNFSEN